MCWQLPTRRSYENRTYDDGKEVLVVVIGEFDRRAWGPGGHDLDWSCSGNTEAHVGTEPVYKSNRDELVALLGQPAYDELARHCEARERLMLSVVDAGGRAGLLPHPADPQ